MADYPVYPKNIWPVRPGLIRRITKIACMVEPKRKKYYSYNLEYAGGEEFSHVQSGGQSPIEKYLALTNIEAGVKAVEYFFIRTGKLYPGIEWAEQR